MCKLHLILVGFNCRFETCALILKQVEDIDSDERVCPKQTCAKDASKVSIEGKLAALIRLTAGTHLTSHA